MIQTSTLLSLLRTSDVFGTVGSLLALPTHFAALHLLTNGYSATGTDLRHFTPDAARKHVATDAPATTLPAPVRVVTLAANRS